jgi:DNA-binding response OmpR family regulator
VGKVVRSDLNSLLTTININIMHKILIVEDEPSMRLGLQDNLEFEGYEIDTAEEGDIGLKKIMENSYDLVLLDVMLPNLSGFDICKTVRKKGINTPIILLTAKGERLIKCWGWNLELMIILPNHLVCVNFLQE